MQFVIEPIEGKASKIFTPAGTFVGSAEVLLMEDVIFSRDGKIQGPILRSWGLEIPPETPIEPRRLGARLYPCESFQLPNRLLVTFNGVRHEALGRHIVGADVCKIEKGVIRVSVEGAVYGGQQ